MEKIKSFIQDNKEWFYIILIYIVLSGIAGLIWGVDACEYILFIPTIICMRGVVRNVYHPFDGRPMGCIQAILYAIPCFLLFWGYSSLDDYAEEKAKEEKKIAKIEKEKQNLLQQEKIKEAKENAENERIRQMVSQLKKMEATDYKALKTTSDLKKYAAFLLDHPESPHFNEVLESYYYLALKNGIKSLNKISEEYHNTKWGERATEDVKRMCDSLYRIADKENTVQGWNTYRAAVPYNYYLDSKEKITDIEWSDEMVAWRQAEKEGNLAAYQRYIRIHPNGAHHTDATKKIIDFVYAGDHGSIPSMENVGNTKGLTSSIIITNSTPYTLNILYDGPLSKFITIPSGHTRNITLKNGTYRIAAYVNSLNVKYYAGTETIFGKYKVKYYIKEKDYNITFPLQDNKIK